MRNRSAALSLRAQARFAWLSHVPKLICLLALSASAQAEPGSMEDAIQQLQGGDEADTDTASQAADEADVPAAEPVAGLREWIDAMQGEVPTEAQVEALVEREEEQALELALTEELSAPAVPVGFYRDPAQALKVDPLHLDRVDPSEFDIPVVVNEDVAKWVAYFTGPGRKYYQRWLTRSTRYRPMMYAELEKEGLPRDLVYLSMIESGYNAHAYSHAGAAGLWQFMEGTAKMYKLRVDWWIDDRRDPAESTGAALDLLKDLHKMFDGDWYLAWASYNTGPGRVSRAAKKAGTKDFWTLAHGDYLHSETENYVPKILAAAIIGKHPERYGFDVGGGEPVLAYDVATVEGTVDLGVIAKAAGTDVETIQYLNPALRRNSTPPEGYEVRVPSGKKDSFVAALAKVPKVERLALVQHTVKRGETLSGIASKYGVKTGDILSANRVTNANRIYVGMQLVVPTQGAVSEAVLASASTPTSRSSASDVKVPPPPPKQTSVTVKSGESLSVIAVRYGVSVAQIKAWNGLKSDTVRVGQVLKLQAAGEAPGSSSGTAAAKPAPSITHVVARGETLSGIAQKYGVASADLKAWNKLTDSSHIEVGQRLTVKGAGRAAPTEVTYVVRGGDSLGKIAEKNGCSVTQLKEWNSLKSSVIQPGQKLVVKR